MLFLLYAADHICSKVVQQQLYVASFTPNEPTMFLHSWAAEIQKTGDNWRDILLEALCIIQAKAIIGKLGLNYIELEQRFLPLNPNSALFIHPIVKLLYFFSEQLTVTEAKQLIDRITTKYASAQDIHYQDNGERLEIFLMYWLGADVLSIGGSRTTCQQIIVMPSNLDPIVEFLKEIEQDSLKEIISSVCNQFNSKRSTSRTDNKEPTDVGDTLRNFHDESNRPIKSADHSYKIQKSNAGILLIINQKTFFPDEHPDLQEFLPTRMLEMRHGTDQDVASLQNTFTTFGYRIVVRENLMHNDLLNAVRNAVNDCIGKDSLIVCILSHGYKGVVFGANSIPVNIEDIENIMTSGGLISRPKILILQACQGDVTQQARDFLQDDGPTSCSLPIYSDLLTCISTVPGFTSIRHTENGSWFIQTLCKKINELAARKHFADILTVVGREVQNLRGRNNQCMVPIYRSTLRMELFFPVS